ncbi:MAG: DUF3617 domain-containing protein [Allosphingosinicella sp.]|uniref:DUF3617 domain-containing protein n=1 Tax=Allosphingosinicella sp. TaxID=2823234 RepID=UPI0039612CD9
MRIHALALLPLLAVSACSENPQTSKAEAATRAASIDGGMWETIAEVKDLKSTDSGTPKIDTPAGTRLTSSLCVGEGDAARPSPALFVGADYDCTYSNFYMRSGRINAQMMCTRKGLQGDIGVTVDGTFTADAFEGTIDTVSYLTTDGDVQIKSQMTGRRTGDCAPEAEAQS